MKSTRRLHVEEFEPRLALSTFYVAPTGSDANPGSITQPFRTVDHGVPLLHAGDTLYIRAGTYAESLINNVPSGTSWTSPVTISAYPGESVTVKPTTGQYAVETAGSYIVFANLTLDGTNLSGYGSAIVYLTTGSDHVRFTGVTTQGINGSNMQNFFVEASSDYNEFLNCVAGGNNASALNHAWYIEGNYNLIDGCVAHDTGGEGIQIYSGSGATCSNNTVRGCTVYNTGRAAARNAIVISVGDSNLIYNNVIYNGNGGGIGTYHESSGPTQNPTNTQILNNTVYNISGGSAVAITSGTGGTVVRNNLLFGTGGSIANSGAGTVQDHNWTSSNGDPLCVNAAAFNFRLQAGSPDINTGATVSAVANDFAGTSRPQGGAYDIGAYEYVAATPTPTTSATQLAASVTSAVCGQTITFTATVTGSSSTPTGTVTFKDGSVTLGTASLSGGSARLAVSSLAVGSHTITAVYGGDSNFQSSTSGGVSETVSQDTTAAALASSAVTLTSGQAVTFSVTITASAPGAGTPTGTVTFQDGTLVLGTGTLSGGKASFTTSGLAAGSHVIAAVYGGDTNFQGSTSAAVTVTVGAVTTAGPTASVSGPSAGVRGQALTFTLGASDPTAAAGSAFTFRIDWNGDGVVDQTVSGPSGTAVSHVFTASGSYNVGVSAVNSLGTAGATATASVSVSAIALLADPLDSSKTALFVGGTTGGDTIKLTPANRSGGIAVTVNGTGLGTFTPTGHVIVYSLGGADTVKEVSRKINGTVYYVNVPAFFFGGNGGDTLDVRGSTANNVLVGGSGNDTLYGGKGRDLLLGGTGSDSLYAGSGEDILVAGSTDFDNNLSALNAMRAEWGRTDIGYATRVAHLNGTLSGGLNGGYDLNSNMVHDDQLTDYLYGNSSVLDWFLAKPGGTAPDQDSGVASGAVVTQIT